MAPRFARFAICKDFENSLIDQYPSSSPFNALATARGHSRQLPIAFPSACFSGHPQKHVVSTLVSNEMFLMANLDTTLVRCFAMVAHIRLDYPRTRDNFPTAGYVMQRVGIPVRSLVLHVPQPRR